jgi:DNA-binding transcriptional ArsR family regulator
MPTTKEKSGRKSAVDVGVVKAIGHPLRMQLLSRLNERVASPVELARELDESVQLVSYHVRILRDLGFVELVSTTPRRGAIEHHYRAIRRPSFSEADFAALPPNARSAIAGTLLESIMLNAASAHEQGAFDENPDASVAGSDYTLDADSFKRLAAKAAELSKFAGDLQTKAAARIAKGAEPVNARLAVMVYPAPAGAPAKRKPAARRRKK